MILSQQPQNLIKYNPTNQNKTTATLMLNIFNKGWYRRRLSWRRYAVRLAIKAIYNTIVMVTS